MWFVVHHPELKAGAVIHRDALDVHRHQGWVRVSESLPDKDAVNLADYVDAPDLDAAKPKAKRINESEGK